MLSDKTVKKHVAIIHAYSLMSTLQRKIVNALIYEALHGHHEFNHSHATHADFKIPLSKISKMIKYKSNNSRYLKEAIDGLASLKIEWNVLKDKIPNDISFLNLRILHGSPTFYQDNTFAFSFHKVFMSLISHPLIYGTIDIDLQAQFESKYSHSLYESCTRFVNMQKGRVIQIETLRQLLCVPDGNYRSTSEFMRNTIQPSVEEVNDRADFYIDLKHLKVARKIVAFDVSVTSKNKNVVMQKPDYTSEQNNIISMIKDTFGIINSSTLTHILKNYDMKYIEEKVRYTKQHAKRGKCNYYPMPYFISALRYDYKDAIKEELNTIKTDTNPNSDSNWDFDLATLQSDLNHWQDRLNFFQANHNEKQINNINIIIAACKKKIQLHIQQRDHKDKVAE